MICWARKCELQNSIAAWFTSRHNMFISLHKTAHLLFLTNQAHWMEMALDLLTFELHSLGGLCRHFYNSSLRYYLCVKLLNCSSWWLLISYSEVSLFFLNWSIVDLQCCVNFCCTPEWFSYIYILFYILFHCDLLQDIEYSSLWYIVGKKSVILCAFRLIILKFWLEKNA